MSCIKKNYNKKIFIEAQNLSNLLISCFLKDKDLKKIHVIRNFKISNLKDNRIQYHYVSKKNSQDKILKKLNKKFNLLNSNSDINQLFS